MRQSKRFDHKKMFVQIILLFGMSIVSIIAAWQLKVVREFFGHAAGTPANFMVDTQAIVGRMPRPWRNLAQGGESHLWSLRPISGKVKALHPEYIRIDHIYDFYDVVQGKPGQLTFNFSKLDKVIDSILATGAKPYLSLSYMPTAISRGDMLDQPVNYTDWQRVVQQTIQHVSGTRGIADVYYEVWNEPDLFGKWKYYGNKNYLTLYRYAALGAMNTRGTKPFKIGGPATTALYKNWVNALLKYAARYHLRLDFISWHRYSNNLNQYKRDILNARSWIARYPQFDGVLETQITEWGHDSNNNAGYDSRFAAAHTVAGAINMVGVLHRGFIFEIQDGQDPQGKKYWGRWGLLTSKNSGSQTKPRYWGLRMLDRIADERLQTLGQGSFVKGLSAKTSDGKIQMVLANYDRNARHRETVPITFQHIQPGRYLLTTKRLSGRNSQEYVATTAAQLKVEIPMLVNDVALIEMSRK